MCTRPRRPQHVWCASRLAMSTLIQISPKAALPRTATSENLPLPEQENLGLEQSRFITTNIRGTPTTTHIRCLIPEHTALPCSSCPPANEEIHFRAPCSTVVSITFTGRPRFLTKKFSHTRAREHSNKLKGTKLKMDNRNYLFTYLLWNPLPQDIVEDKNLSRLKKGLDIYKDNIVWE